MTGGVISAGRGEVEGSLTARLCRAFIARTVWKRFWQGALMLKPVERAGGQKNCLPSIGNGLWRDRTMECTQEGAPRRRAALMAPPAPEEHHPYSGAWYHDDVKMTIPSRATRRRAWENF